MGEEEMRTLRRAFSPRVEAVHRRVSAHTLATGHATARVVSAMLLGYRGRPRFPPR
jgi:hypothetical protein